MSYLHLLSCVFGSESLGLVYLGSHFRASLSCNPVTAPVEPGEESTSELTQVVGRILRVVGLRLPTALTDLLQRLALGASAS